MVADFEPANVEMFQLANENVFVIMILSIQSYLEIPAVQDRCYGIKLFGLSEGKH